jgi:hypothetical protein
MQNSQNRTDVPFTHLQPRSVFSQKRSQRPFQSASRSRSPSPFQRQNSQNVGDRANYQLRDRSNERISQIPRQSQTSQPFSGITLVQRVEPSSTCSEETNRSSYNSGIDRLRSQNSHFNSGEIRNYRDRQSSAERNNNNQQRYQSRSFSPRRPYNRDLSRDRQDNYYYRQNPPTYVAAQAERERENNNALNFVHLYQITSSVIAPRSVIITSLQANLLEISTLRSQWKKLLYRKTIKAPPKSNLC